jgi:hypothetical protein
MTAIIVNGHAFDDLTQAQEYMDWLDSHGRAVVAERPQVGNEELEEKEEEEDA